MRRMIPIIAAVSLFACKGGDKTDVKTPKPAATKPAEPTVAPKPEPKPEPTAPAGAVGKISGMTSFAGTAPAEATIDMKSDKKCAELSPGAKTQNYLIADGKLGSVFVYVKNAPEGSYKAPDAMPVLDQKGCMYQPNMIGLQKGQSVEIVNSDPTLHNIHAYGKQEFNIGMPTQGQRLKRKMKKEEVLIQVKCDVHPWMEAHIGVVEHPFFAVTDASGAFEIADVPAGKYTLAAVHPKLGEQTMEIEVVAAGQAKASFEFSVK